MKIRALKNSNYIRDLESCAHVQAKTYPQRISEKTLSFHEELIHRLSTLPKCGRSNLSHSQYVKTGSFKKKCLLAFKGISIRAFVKTRWEAEILTAVHDKECCLYRNSLGWQNTWTSIAFSN